MKTDSGTSANSTGNERPVWLPTWPRLTAPIELRTVAHLSLTPGEVETKPGSGPRRQAGSHSTGKH